MVPLQPRAVPKTDFHDWMNFRAHVEAARIGICVLVTFTCDLTHSRWVSSSFINKAAVPNLS